MTTEERIEYAIQKGFTGNLETGLVFSHTGMEFKSKSTDGYIHCSFRKDGRSFSFKAHQLIWYLANGYIPDYSKMLTIDHSNQIKDDNRLFNLSVATHSQQMKNRPKFLRRVTGAKGYTKTPNGTFAPWICNEESKIIHLGCFDTEEEAIAVRKAAEIQYGYRQ